MGRNPWSANNAEFRAVYRWNNYHDKHIWIVQRRKPKSFLWWKGWSDWEEYNKLSDAWKESDIQGLLDKLATVLYPNANNFR